MVRRRSQHFGDAGLDDPSRPEPISVLGSCASDRGGVSPRRRFRLRRPDRGDLELGDDSRLRRPRRRRHSDATMTCRRAHAIDAPNSNHKEPGRQAQHRRRRGRVPGPRQTGRARAQRGDRARKSGSDPDGSLDAAITPSTPRDHPGRRRADATASTPSPGKVPTKASNSTRM